jgi:hypothetical protein
LSKTMTACDPEAAADGWAKAVGPAAPASATAVAAAMARALTDRKERRIVHSHKFQGVGKLE